MANFYQNISLFLTKNELVYYEEFTDDIIIIGGLKKFLEEFPLKTVIIKQDNCKPQWKLCEKLGFECAKVSSPHGFYARASNSKRVDIRSTNYSKDELIKVWDAGETIYQLYNR